MSFEDEVDFRNDAPQVTRDQMSLVSVIASELLSAFKDEAIAEQNLANAKAHRVKLETQDLPEAMADANMKRFDHVSGKSIVVKDVVTASVSKPRLPEMLEWLRSHGSDGIIKRCISAAVRLPKGQDALGNGLIAYLKQDTTLRAFGVILQDDPEINHQTLGKWTRECYEAHVADHIAGHPDQDCVFCDQEAAKLFGVYVGKKAEIKDIS